ncbi:MAG: SDR family oxidoreductase [Planctomycetes bacterium]|nr:SDR family oxidoreductase [Planctomycetota bacterium]
MSDADSAARPPVSLVTGSVRGLGLAVARAFAARGDHTHVVWRGSKLLAAERELEFPGRTHRADLARAADATRLVDEVLARDARLDHVVHAVGAYASGPLESTGFAVWREMLESNLETALHLVDAVRAPLRAARGTLVLFGCAGLEGLGARREAAAYAGAKSALLVFARSLALEEAPHGVRVNVLSPGLVPHAHAHPETSAPARVANVPLGRAGTAEEVAEAALWLSSPRSSYTLGADLPVSGGWLL